MISNWLVEKGKFFVNWIVEFWIWSKDDEDFMLLKMDWIKLVDISVFEGFFEMWKCGGLSMKELIDEIDKVYEFFMSDCDFVDRWFFGCLIFFGDVVYVMYFIGSNGVF